MSEIETSRNNENRVDNDASGEMIDESDARTIETVRRWTQAVTAADHKAMYESSGRDYKTWAEREDHQQAS